MSATQTFLLELHCEEIPARFLAPLTEEFGSAFQAWLNGQGLSLASLDPFYSPRKLAWRAQGLPAFQPDQTDSQVGPPQRMCVDEAGQPTIQGLKFAEKWGVDFGVVRFEQPAGKKEPCAVVTITRKGRPTAELLMEALPGLIAGLHVPKAMRWGKSEFEFVRPIRNILCLFGDQVVPVTVDGVTASNTTWGHRLFHRQHPGPVTIAMPEAYEAALEAAGVVVSVDARRARIATQLEALAAEAGGRVVTDAELLDTLAEIVEFPKIVRGEFPATFLELPKEVLVTSLREHQKSFCIEGPDGALLPFFLTAANRTDDPAGFVKAGNEWVLKARLYDARFFFAEDRKLALSARLEKLKALTFQRELGSYHDKTGRVVALVKTLASRLSNDDDHIDRALEAARMAKCDLRTLMVGEFPELQGVMGGEYLKHEGAHEEVWKAVKEHYRPVGADDAIPGTPMGCLLSLCDKLDTVAGCFAVGLVPSGSKDPLALRRAGQGIVRILWEQGWALPPAELIAAALRAVGTRATKPEAETAEALRAFFKDRVAYQLELAGYAGSVRRSALAAGWEDLVDLKARCEALSAFAEDPRFASLAQSAKRIGNILKDEMPAERFDGGLLTQVEEKELAEHLAKLEGTADQKGLLTALADLAQPLEAFFNAVMVKCEDPGLRAARLSLLHRLRQAFLRVADFSLWQ
ncbi:glycine--tRNA ligase beta subunit [Geothrix oryzae]|uniref:Glycine--tRNA ligase beta subunit n=1 Tax=Geothrix oryzae TaxID=2927975 RepID=A0ABM8DS24_9BACT|nr:glycine--tRNA ligase subunit beta [Geothrix oryzae]BDU69822.1 glycine--tRNA ligase beta subunit [Geothrix oryzae]